jgi:Phytanoyl-CoA dioxygenase (PhyH)
MTSVLAKELDHHGVVVLPDLVTPEQLRGMQAAFASRLSRQRWNDLDGYFKTEPYRLMLEDLLLTHPAFLDVAMNPRITEAVREYVGPGFQLIEAKGWQSNPTKYDFHGWHGDAWYDQARVQGHIPREVKLGVYLTDVKSGAFKYIKGSHGRQAPRGVRTEELADTPPQQIQEVLGKAGTAFLFDTSGIHRQSIPILEKRHAIFYGYHDPAVPLQPEDVEYYRYHPLLLNAAFLGGLSKEDERILGFGDKRCYQEHFSRQTDHKGYHAALQRFFDLKLRVGVFYGRATSRLRRLLGLDKAKKPPAGMGMGMRS